MKRLKYWLPALAITFGCIYAFFFSYEELKRQSVKSFTEQQLLLTRQASKGLETFFENQSQMLKYLAQQEDIAHFNAKGAKLLKDFFEAQSDLEEVIAVSRVDAQGRMAYTYPPNPAVIGKDLTHQEHNRKIITSMQPIVSSVFTAVQGYQTVAFSYPIVCYGKYCGCLGLLISFDRLSKKHFERIRIGARGFGWMLSRNGVKLFCQETNYFGGDPNNHFIDHPQNSKLMAAMLRGEEGIVRSPFYSEKEAENKYWHTIYAPVRLPDNHWSLGVNIAEKEMLAAMSGFRTKWLAVIALTVLACALFFAQLKHAWSVAVEEKRMFLAERRLRVSEAKYREFFDETNEAIFVLDAENGAILDVNQAMLEMFSYNREETKNIGINDISLGISPYSNQEIMTHLKKALKQGGQLFEWHCRRRDQSLFWAEVALRRSELEEESRVLAVFRDISDRKEQEERRQRLEEELHHARKLEALGTLAGGIAHDFNNLLAAMLGYAELAGLDLPKEHRAQESINEVVQAALRAKELVQQILLFSRQGAQEKKMFCLSKAVRDSLSLIRGAVAEGISIKANIEKTAGTICANPIQIHQVVMNLCNNAAQAMNKKGGEIKVSLALDDSKSSMEQPLDSTFALLTIKDNGPGISLEHQAKIFDPYFSTKGLGVGTGLGLAVVHGIVQALNGHIEVESADGCGTTFRVYIPIFKEDSPKEVELLEELPRGKGHIALVDDDFKVIGLVSSMLKRLGYSVTEFTSGKDLLALFQQKPYIFDLVLTDQQMPEMTGLHLTKELIKIRADLPIIIYSGYDRELSPEAVQKAGACELAYKPLSISELAKLVYKNLSSTSSSLS